MLPFGVQEIPTSRGKVEPGWAYVADTGINPSQAALRPTNQKRARNLTTAGGAATSQDLYTKQDAKTLRELAQLEKDSFRDAQISIPVRNGVVGRVHYQKTTPSVRKILASQKTFANHLADAEANAVQAISQTPAQQSTSVPSTPLPTSSNASPRPTPTPHLTASGKRSHKKKDPSQLLRRVSTINASNDIATTPLRNKASIANDTTPSPPTLTARPLLQPLPSSLIRSHPLDASPLLKSHIPDSPTTTELHALLTHPPLSYLEARGQLTGEDLARPVRSFCEICGYWGRVKCLGCGGRVCALECLREHKIECYTRYGA